MSITHTYYDLNEQILPELVERLQNKPIQQLEVINMRDFKWYPSFKRNVNYRALLYKLLSQMGYTNVYLLSDYLYVVMDSKHIHSDTILRLHKAYLYEIYFDYSLSLIAIVFLLCGGWLFYLSAIWLEIWTVVAMTFIILSMLQRLCATNYKQLLTKYCK